MGFSQQFKRLGPLQSQGIDHFGIGTVGGAPGHTTFSVVEEFDSATFERYERALHKATAPTYRFAAKLVELNFHSYLNHEKFAGILIGLGRSFAQVDPRVLIESVTSQIINWLTSFRLYLDYAETALKREFGDASDQVRAFKERTAEAFDDHVGYRFIYKFRNYVQHCGPPISSLSVSRPTTTQSNPYVVQTASFRLNRNELFERFDWGIVRSDLEQIDASFELLPLAQEAMDQLREIESVLLEMSIAEAARTIHDLRQALERLPSDAEGTPALFRYSEGGDEAGSLHMSPQTFTREMVHEYGRVASGELTPAGLRQPAVAPPPSPLDPATVRERFRRESRAVQAMALWQTEGSGTPAFLQGINRMLEEDGGPTILLTGMFNMTAVLLHMTAASLGVRPDGLLGGLLDVYGRNQAEPPVN